jgi:hypothetical protein
MSNAAETNLAQTTRKQMNKSQMNKELMQTGGLLASHRSCIVASGAQPAMRFFVKIL